MGQLIYTEIHPYTGLRKALDICQFYGYWWFNYLYCRLWFGLRIEGNENIPQRGPALLVCNHLSFIDANLIQAASPRKVSFMIAREYHDALWLHWICHYLGCIPVNRNGQDLGAIKKALKGLTDNMLLGMFPEGGISETGEMQAAKEGIALLAIRSKCPVVPIHLSGYRYQNMVGAVLYPKRTRIRVGKPLFFDHMDTRDRGDLLEVTRQISASIGRLGGSSDEPSGESQAEETAAASEAS
jgi:1-acyl-sn-glycerol-3-phosphate acyltransferase